MELLVFCTHHGLIFISGMGAHVKKTVSSKKDLRPHTSDNAPISGALRNDNRPWRGCRDQDGTQATTSRQPLWFRCTETCRFRFEVFWSETRGDIMTDTWLQTDNTEEFWNILIWQIIWYDVLFLCDRKIFVLHSLALTYRQQTTVFVGDHLLVIISWSKQQLALWTDKLEPFVWAISCVPTLLNI